MGVVPSPKGGMSSGEGGREGGWWVWKMGCWCGGGGIGISVNGLSARCWVGGCGVCDASMVFGVWYGKD